ncbi:unnamed protein product [Symbiodinium sp. CCMP2592]|nr:unnamed protein product [Symbiodinium sp. CCMP2592]
MSPEAHVHDWGFGLSSQDKGELLKRWVSAAENLSACEHQIVASKRANLRGTRKVALVSVKDRDCPGVVEETKYWVTIEESKTDTVDIGHEERLTVNATPTGANAFNILAGPSDPGMLERPRGNSEMTKPLCGDVLRAYDSYRENLVPLNEEVFRTDAEKHDKWSSEIKRELASLSSVLIDIPQDDDLKTELERCNKRLKGLALKFKTAKTGPEMVTELKILRGKAKGLIQELKKCG